MQTSGYRFIRIDEACRAAVFVDDSDMFTREEILLDESSLRARIANLTHEAPHLDLFQEQVALIGLVRIGRKED
jgi:hypothetical protein